MGQALYRKYRSRSMAEIVGQEHITTVLEHALKEGTVSHAYLLTGPRGVGKTSVARILAHAVNDLPYSDESSHLDIIEIDAASHRRIDEIRELRERVHSAPTSAKYKVYIIDEVHMLTRESFNALLKTLEEPPAHVIFILATTEAHKLPETIISRTQRLSFRPVSPEKVAEHLKSIAKAEKIKIDDDALMHVAKYGEGSFRDSISLLDQVRNQKDHITLEDVLKATGQPPAELIAGLADSIFSQTASDAVHKLTSLREQGYEASQVAEQLGRYIRSKFINDPDQLPSNIVLPLLRTLIDVPGSSNPDASLEIAVLQSISTPSASSVPTTPPTSISPKKPIEPATPPRRSVAKNNSPDIKLDDKTWQSVLQSIKKSRNSLYSALRLAKADWEGNHLTLTFGFAFHQKRVDDPANRQIILQTIAEITGHEVAIECQVDPQLAHDKSPDEDLSETTDNPNGDPMIENISNIFGGAEVLES